MSQSLNIIKSKVDELPNNIEAEQSVIGSILLVNEIFDEESIDELSEFFHELKSDSLDLVLKEFSEDYEIDDLALFRLYFYSKHAS